MTHKSNEIENVYLETTQQETRNVLQRTKEINSQKGEKQLILFLGCDYIFILQRVKKRHK